MLVVASSVRLHLVHGNEILLYPRKLDQSCLLPSLSQNFAIAAVERQGDRRCTGGRVLQETFEQWRSSDGAMPLLCGELLRDDALWSSLSALRALSPLSFSRLLSPSRSSPRLLPRSPRLL